MGYIEPGRIVHLRWGMQRSPGRSETKRQAKLFERGGDRVVQGICFNEELKRQGESLGSCVQVSGDEVPRYS